MKTTKYLALVAGAFLFGACSNNDALEGGNENEGAAQQIVLQVTSGGDGLQTRAGRPLYSSAALQSIDNVRVLIYKADETKTIVYDSQKSLDWKKSLEYTTGGHGRRLTITLKGEDKIQTAGNYKIVAVGYSTGSDYTFDQNVAGAESLKNNAYSDITATLAAGKNAEEVFAGDADLKIDDKLNVENKATGELGAAVTLRRQVAGGFGYFTNIPAHIDGVTAKTLRLVMRSKNTKLIFNDFNSNFTEFKQNLKYVVNGSVPAATETGVKFSDGGDAYVLYSIDLTKWFPKGDVDKNGFLGYEDYQADNTAWTRPENIHAGMLKGSVFASNFIIPFAYTDGKNTMELQLLAEDGHIIKVWNVTIPDANSNADLGLTDKSASIFNVVRNHMYNLGIKNKQDVTPEPGNPDPNPNPNPDPDPKPTPDPDNQPEDLSKGQNLVLKVNDNWETIHQMGLE